MATLKTYALTNETRLKTFIGVTGADDDELLKDIINAVTSFVENYCNRRFQQTAYEEEEYTTDSGDTSIILKQWPVISGETFLLEIRTSALNEDDWEDVDSEDYFVDLDAGIVEGAADQKFLRGVNKYRVSYTAGYDFNLTDKPLAETEAGDLEWAVWKLCALAYHRRKGTAGVISESIGDYSVTFMKEVFEDDEIKKILAKYSRFSGGHGVITPTHT